MKILSVYFKNLNSLKGEHRLAFDRAPLAGAGVFAITGPNGSGKTTILDAITLGLYGQTFRFDRPADHVISKHTQDSCAEVVFQLGDQQFRAEWRVARDAANADTVSPLQPEMRLSRADGDGQLLAEQPQQVRNAIADMTGLDFRRFTRSIMLAQGDFAAYLNALDNERLDILEKIANTDLYNEFRADIARRSADAQAEIARLNAAIDSLGLFDDDKLQACEFDLQDFIEELSIFKARQATLLQQQSWLQNLDSIAARIAQLQAARDDAERLVGQCQTDLQDIANGQAALAYRDELSALDALAAAIQDERQAVAGLHAELAELHGELQARGELLPVPAEALVTSLPELRQRYDDAIYRQEQLGEDRHKAAAAANAIQQQLDDKQQQLQSVLAWMEARPNGKKLLEDFPDLGKLKKLRTDLATLQAEQKLFDKSQKNAFVGLQRSLSRSARLTRKIDGLQRKLQKLQANLQTLSQGREPEEIAQLRHAQQERVNEFKALLALATSNARFAKEYAQIQSRLHGSDMDAPSLRVEQQVLNDKLQREQNIKKVLEQVTSQEVVIKRLAAERPQLVDGKPCPLCGSLQHPFALHPPAVGDSRRALADQQKKLQNLQAELQRLTQRIQVAEKLAADAQQQDQRLQQVRSQWLSLCGRLNRVGGEMRIDNFRLMKRMFKTEKAAFDDWVSLEKKTAGLRAKCQKLAALVQRYQAEAEHLHSDRSKLEANWKGRPYEEKELRRGLEICSEDLDELLQKVAKQLAAVGEKTPAHGKEDALFDQLNARRHEYHAQQLRRDAMLDELHALEEARVVDDARLADFDRRLAESDALIRMLETQMLQAEQQRLQQHSAALQQALAQREATYAEAQQALLGQLASHGYIDLAAYRTLVALADRQDGLQQTLADAQRRQHEIATLLLKTEQQQQAEQELQLTYLNVAQIDAQLRDIGEKMDIASAEIRHAEEVLFGQKKLAQRKAQLQESLQQQQQILAQCQAELQPQGEANFRRHVQKSMAERLLGIANAYLQKISGRYYLHQRDDGQGLALEIEDGLQQNVRRLPKTLSGGETFVVSLALALALAEMVGNGRSVDSLFIDEGFGNLDREALELVINTLKDLRHFGKTVGIISHVESVGKRIETQIVMSKAKDGSSQLAVVA